MSDRRYGWSADPKTDRELYEKYGASVHEPKPTTVEQIISGGQTGVDRAALDFAIERGFKHGGWIPKGRKAEDGQVPKKYFAMKEHLLEGYPARTESNVREGDATVIFTSGVLNDEPGCLLTVNLCRRLEKPYHVISITFDVAMNTKSLATFLLEKAPRVLNVAGTRGSMRPDLDRVREILSGAL